jgi:D-alanine-D-alanine ligase
MEKLRVAIICGGRSAEHEVSLQSALNVWDEIDRARWEPSLVGIDKTGKWFAGNGVSMIVNRDNPAKIALDTTVAQPIFPGQVSADVVFPILHGPYGEDGTVQGLFKMAGLPFVGAGVLGSAVGMDKDIQKRLLREAGLPLGAFIASSALAPVGFDEAAAKLGVPFFVKPANMGSSVGAGKVATAEEFAALTNEAFQYDAKIILEEYVRGRELECAVLGNDNPMACEVGEIIPKGGFYSYEAKYIDKDGAVLKAPAELPDATRNAVKRLAVAAFKTLSCAGLARVDFFLRKDGSPLINEINTMPGFTKISMYPKLCGLAGISYGTLITRLLELALERFDAENRLKVSRE